MQKNIILQHNFFVDILLLCCLTFLANIIQQYNMNAITINISPRTFGNIAAAAFASGCDVTSFVRRSAADKAAATRRANAEMQQTPANAEHITPTEDSELAIANGSGLLDL